MANDNKWEYDYSNIYNRPATHGSNVNVGSSGTNTANQSMRGDYYTQAPVEERAAPVQDAAPVYDSAPVYETVPSPDLAQPAQTVMPTGAVGGMPPPPPYGTAQGSKAGKRAKRTQKKKQGVVGKVIGYACGLVAVAAVGFLGGYVGSLYAGTESSSVVLQQITRESSELTSISTSTDGNDLSIVSAAAIASESVVVITTEEMVASSTWYGTATVESGAGSGVIISEDGYILTCAHVVADASSIVVTIGEENYSATVAGSDEETDIAVIKIDASGLTPAVIGDSDALVVGETVLAVGNPLGVLGGSVTQGIVSALNRLVTVNGYEMTLIQMDASVSPGNSGGGLFNMAGELVGVVNAKSSSSTSEGIGFSIPINTAIEIATSLIENGYVTGRPELGIVVISISDADTAAAYGVSALGVYVYSVNEGSAAQAAGLQAGDRLISIEDVEISAMTDVTDLVESKEVGDVVTLLIARNGQMMTATVTLGEQGSSTAVTASDSSTTTPQEGATAPDSSTAMPEEDAATPDVGMTDPEEGGATLPDGSTMPEDGATTTPENGMQGGGSSNFPSTR